MAVVNIHPVYDGRVFAQNASWALCRGATTGTVAEADPLNIGDSYNGSVYAVRRGFFTFDLSSIPNGSTVNSVAFKLTPEGLPASSDPLFHRVTSANPASTTGLVGDDFDNVGSTEFGSIDPDTFVDETEFSITLNASGIAYIQGLLGGNAVLAFRGGRDFENDAPVGTQSYQANFYSYRQTGTSKDPELLIDYTLPLPSGGNPIFFSGGGLGLS